VRYWDIHRHRIAPQVAATLDALRVRGQLRVTAGRLCSITADPGGGSHVHFRPRHACREHMLRADWIVNATGVETNIDLRPGALLAALRERGLVLPGPQGLGVASSGIGHVIGGRGRPDPALYVLGALRIGELWESIAIPELREQARQIADDILAARTRPPRPGSARAGRAAHRRAVGTHRHPRAARAGAADRRRHPGCPDPAALRAAGREAAMAARDARRAAVSRRWQ